MCVIPALTCVSKYSCTSLSMEFGVLKHPSLLLNTVYLTGKLKLRIKEKAGVFKQCLSV